MSFALQIYSRDCGWPRRPWPNAGRKKSKKPKKNLLLNYFAHGRFPEVGQKQKTEKKKERKREREKDWKMVIPMAMLRMAHASTLGARKHAWRTQAALVKSKQHTINSNLDLIGPGGLRVPCIAWPLLSPSFSLLFSSLFLAQTACVRHACLRATCVVWPLFLPSFSFSFFLFLRLLLLTHFGESPVCENLFPPIFCHN